MTIKVLGCAAMAALLCAPGAGAQAPSNAQRMQTQAAGDVPQCSRKHGTISIRNGDDSRGWNQVNLGPPEKLLRVIVQRSGCFNIVDRAAGLGAATAERDLNNNLGLQRGSNVGIGQVKAADYVLVAEVQAQNGDSGGGGVAGALGGLIGGRVGGLVGGIKTRKLEANTVLSLTNVRTTETVAVEDGYAVKNDVSWAAGGGVSWTGGAVGGGYENTDIGRIVTLSFINAYSKLVASVESTAPGATGTTEASPQKAFTAIAPVTMRKTASAAGKVVRQVQPGSTVYPTGKKDGLWWEVADENDNVGWVLNTKLQPAR